MKKEQIIRISGLSIDTTGGRRRAIGNADHKVGDWVWVDGRYVFGHHVVVNSAPYLPAEADTILYTTAETICAVKISGAFTEWEDIEPAYNDVNRYFCYNESAICTMTKSSTSMSWLKKYRNGVTETGSFPFIDAILSKAYLDEENKLQGMFLNSEGVYQFVDSEVSVLSEGFPSALPATVSYADDTYNYVYYASDDYRFYDGYLSNKILFSTEGFSKWIINEEYPLEEWYKKFITIGGNKVPIWHSAGAETNIPYHFTIGVHADYYLEWVNDGSASFLTATSVTFKQKDGTVNTDITQYISGRYIELLSIMPVLVMTRKYMLLSFGDYLVLFDHVGRVLASHTYGTGRTLNMPFVTKQTAERLINLLK